MNQTAKNTIGLIGYVAAALLLTLFEGGGGVLAGMVIFVATVLLHLIFNRCPYCGKFLGFVSFSRQCKRCGKEL